MKRKKILRASGKPTSITRKGALVVTKIDFDKIRASRKQESIEKVSCEVSSPQTIKK